MKLIRRAVAGLVLLAVLGAATPSHAEYKKVETYTDTWAFVDASDCTIFSLTCTNVMVWFGFDESHSPAQYVTVEVYHVDLTGPLASFELVAEGSWWDGDGLAAIATNRKAASYFGYVDLYTWPCNQITRECSGATVSPLLQVTAAATSSKGGSLKKQAIELPGCKVQSAGTYSSRRGKVGMVTLGSDVLLAFERTGSVVIEKDSVKLTTTGCVGLSSAVAAQRMVDAQVSVRQAASPGRFLRRR